MILLRKEHDGIASSVRRVVGRSVEGRAQINKVICKEQKIVVWLPITLDICLIVNKCNLQFFIIPLKSHPAPALLSIICSQIIKKQW